MVFRSLLVAQGLDLHGVLGVECWVSGFGSRVFGVECWVSGFGCRVFGVRALQHSILNTQ